MGEKETKPFQLTCNGLRKVDFQGSRVTSDGGLILVREWDERLGLGKLIGEHLSDSRRHQQAVHVRCSVAAVGRQPLGG